MCEDVRWKAITGSRDLLLPFTGRVLTRQFADVFDHSMEQRVANVSSVSPPWRCVLDLELCAVADMTQRLQTFGSRVCKQLRVDGCVAQIPRRLKPQLLAWNDEKWPCGLPKYKVEQLTPDSRTLINVGVFNPVCAVGVPPKGCGGWEYLSQTDAEAHMKAAGSIYLPGGWRCWSSEKRPRPVSRRKSSLRGIDLPIIEFMSYPSTNSIGCPALGTLRKSHAAVATARGHTRSWPK